MPETFYGEVAGVLRRQTVRGEIAEQRATEALDRLLVLQTGRASVKPLIAEAWELRHNVTIADALYVVLARRLDAPLVTGDRRLAGAPGLNVRIIVE